MKAFRAQLRLADTEMRQALMDECRRDRDGLPLLMDDFERLLAELGTQPADTAVHGQPQMDALQYFSHDSIFRTVILLQ